MSLDTSIGSGGLSGSSRRALTVPETAAALSLSTDKVYALIRADVIPHKKIGRRYIVPIRALEAWLDENDE